MENNKQISSKGVFISLVKSIDAYNWLLKDHHRRVTAFAYQLGSEYGLGAKRLAKLVIAASIHDIGAIYVAERDQLTKMDVDDPEPHQINGARILRGIKPLEGVRRIIRRHHVRYEDMLTGQVNPADICEECWFLHLADRIDIGTLMFADDSDPHGRIRETIRPRFGRDFLPELAGTFERAANSEEFWRNADQTAYQELLLSAVDTELADMGPADLESYALLFGRIVDHKSHWTLTHSRSVGFVAERIGELMNLPGETRSKLRIAGYLHDIGKIAVPAEILEKPSPLDRTEYSTMQTHALFSSLILSGNDDLADIGRWAGNHHERRDRSGYPMKIGEDRFETEMDIIAYADIFTALLEARPYRASLDKDEAMDILRELSPLKLSKEVFSVVSAHFDDLATLLEESEPFGTEENVPGAFARGDTARYL